MVVGPGLMLPFVLKVKSTVVAITRQINWKCCKNAVVLQRE